MDRYPHVPREAVRRKTCFARGIAFDASALSDNLDGEVKPKSYFIFSFDQRPLAELGEAARRRPPEELALIGGPYELRRTIVSVRVNPGSPYRVALGENDTLAMTLDGRAIADVGLPPMPEYYRHPLANGKTVMETAPTIQWGYLIYLTVLRLCQYFGAKEECGFCDINHNWRQHKREGRPYTGVKPVADVLEALELIDRYDTDGRARHTRSPAARSRARSTGSTRRSSTAATRRRSRSASPAAGSARSSRRRCRRGRPALQGLRDRDLPPELRGVGQAALLVICPESSATSDARSGTGASWTRPRCSAPRT